MSNSQEIRTGRHCVFNMHVHLVFVAKYRRDVFTKAMLETMCEVFDYGVTPCGRLATSLHHVEVRPLGLLSSISNNSKQRINGLRQSLISSG